MGSYIFTCIFCKFKNGCLPLARAIRDWDHMSCLVKLSKSYKPSNIWDFTNEHHA